MKSASSLRLIQVACLVLLSTGAGAQITKVGQGYQFRMKFVKGQSLKYLINSEVMLVAAPGGSKPTPMKITIPTTQTVMEVKNKIATILFSTGPVQMNGQPFGNQGAETQTVQMDSRGKAVGGTKLPQGLNTELPAKPIRVGETWTSTVPFAGPMGGGGGGQLKSTYKFLGLKNVAGKQVAELAVSAASTGIGGPSGSGKMFLIAADGSMFKADIAMKMAMPGAQGQPGAPMNLTLTMRRL